MSRAGQELTLRTPRYWLTAAAVALAYLVVARFGMSLAFATKQVTAIWPPTGVAFVVLLVLGRGMWPGVFLGAFLANATFGETFATAAGIAGGNTLAAVVGVSLVVRFCRFHASLDRVGDVLALTFLGSGVACTVSATLGVTNLIVADLVPTSDFWAVWRVWWLGDTLGVLLVAPFLLGWRLQTPPLRGARVIELALLAAGALVVCKIALAGGLLGKGQQFRLEYAVFPFVIWAAVRFELREAATVSLAVCGFAIWGATRGRGPFALGTLDHRLMLLDTFMAVVALTALTLNAVVSERREAQKGLEAAKAQLELRVVERTRELASANVELASANVELARKNEEVEAFVYIVSHDLRAPLVNLQGFSSELSQSCAELVQRLSGVALPPDVAAPVRDILAQDIPGSLRFISAGTTKFQRLIDALLTLSRYGRQPLARDEIDVRALVDATIDSLHLSAVRTGSQFVIGELPNFRGDLTAVGQVFANLLVNALNYLQPGRPGLIEVGGQVVGDMVRYWVKDNGAGIPASAQRRVFQVFQRFHPERAQGEGMGLAIVKRVVERHGGAISADSEEGVGTTFTFSFPAATRRDEAA